MSSEKVELFQHRGIDIYRLSDSRVGLDGFLALTPITPGLMNTAIGGVRNLSGQGKSPEFALDLACDLACAMRDKSWAIKGLKIGGAKTVLFGSGKKTPEFLRAAGASLERFNLRYGTSDLPRYIYSVDVNTSVPDVADMHEGLAYRCWSEGDPSPETAKGVAASVLAFFSSDLYKKRNERPSVYITGVLGAVGSVIAKHLWKAGVVVYGKDIVHDPSRIAQAERDGVVMLLSDDIPRVDVYVPCAMGGILNKKTIPEICAAGIQAVIGSANCQLEDGDNDALLLHQAGILYAVDYVVNRGGLIFVAGQWRLMTEPERAIDETGDEVLSILALSRMQNKPTTVVAREYFGKFQAAG